MLRQHARRQHAEQVAAAAAGRQSYAARYVFTRADGTPLHPDYVSQRFRLLADRSGLPPIRPHGPRHGAATVVYTRGRI